MLAKGKQVGIGAGNVTYAELQAVVKSNQPIAPYCVPNELICGEIGRYLQLPIPPGGLVEFENQVFFASLDFNLAGESLPPIVPATCVEALPFLAAGVLVFDAFIANNDRHPRNLSLDLSVKKPRLMVFDHGHALLGDEPSKSVERFKRVEDRLGIAGGEDSGGVPHCLLDHLKVADHLDAWLKRVEQVPGYVIEGVCERAVGLGITDAEAGAASDFLKNRRHLLRSIVKANRAQFKGIIQWGLWV